MSKLPMTIEVAGGIFNVTIEDSIFYIQHDKSSLSGSGKTLADAIIAMLKEAKEIRGSYCKVPLSALTPGAIELRNYLFEIV